MKRAEVQLPDPLYEQLERKARELQLSIDQLLCKVAAEMVQQEGKSPPQVISEWRFPEGRRLGPFVSPVEDWRLLANEDAAR